MRIVRIDVTREDIKEGLPCRPRYCPIALASERAGLENPLVGNTTITFGDPDLRQTVGLPRVALTWIKHCDDHCEVQPFAFDQEIPECASA